MTHHWREYPVGFAGELARMFVRTLAPFGVMLVLTFLLMVAIGVSMEEGIADDVLATMGHDVTTRDHITTMMDQLFRVAMVVLLMVGYLSGLAVCIALCVRDITASTAVAAAASAGAPRTAVPVPEQVESIITQRFLPLRMLLIITACCGVFFGLVMLAVSLAEDYPEMVPAGAGVVAGGVVLLLPVLLVQRVLEPRHRARREVIAAHWTQADEQAVWDAVAEQADQPTSPISRGVSRNPLVDRGTRITDVSARAAGVAMLLFFVLTVITHPFGNRYDAGPRVTYVDTVETAITVGYWVELAALVLCVVCAVVGQVVEGAGRTAERAALRELMAQPRPPRPPVEIARDYGQRRPVRLAQALAMLSGIAVIVGPSAWWLATVPSELFDDAVVLFAPFRDAALVTGLAGVVLFAVACVWNAVANVRSAGVRNEILRLWPTEPDDQEDSDGNPIPARVGPALRWRPEPDGD